MKTERNPSLPPKKILHLYYELSKQLNEILTLGMQEEISEIFIHKSVSDEIMVDALHNKFSKYNFKPRSK